MMHNQKILQESYLDLAPQIFRYAMSKLGNREQAEDITSEAFTRLLAGKDLREIENIKYWAITVARNLIYDKYRKNDREAVAETVMESAIEEIDESKYEVSEVEDEAIAAELIDLIKVKLTELDDLTREVIVLRIWEGLQFNEIAEIQSSTESNIKFKFYRGIDKLKQIIESEQNKSTTKSQTESKKVRSISIPLLLAGLKQTMHAADYALNPSIASSLSNLLINQNSMTAFIAKLKMIKPIYWLIAAICGSAVIAIIIVVIVMNNRGVGNPNPSSSSESTSVSSSAPSKVEQYLERFDVMSVEKGEVFLSNFEQTDRLQITNTGGMVRDAKVAPDFKTIAYTIQDPSLVKPIADDLVAKVNNIIKSQPGFTPDALRKGDEYDHSLAVRLLTLNLETDETKTVVEWENFDPGAAGQYTAGAPHLIWEENGITLGSFNNDNSDQITYLRRGVWALDLESGVQTKITESRKEGMCHAASANWQDDAVAVDLACWESGGTEVYKYSDGKFVEFNPSVVGLNIATGIGSMTKFIGVDEQGLMVVDRIELGDYLKNGSTTPTENKLLFIDIDTQKIVKEVSINDDGQRSQTIISDGNIYTMRGSVLEKLGENGQFTPVLNLKSTSFTDNNVSYIKVKGDLIIASGYKITGTSGNYGTTSFGFVYNLVTQQGFKLNEQASNSTKTNSTIMSFYGN